MVPRSVAKYAADVGSRAVVRIIAGEAENRVKILTETLEHEKVAGVKVSVKKLRQEQKQNQ